MRFVMRVIRPVVVRVVGTYALSHPSSALILMRMFVHMPVGGVQRHWIDVERRRKGCKAMGTRSPDRREEGPEQDHQQNQPAYARCCPVGAQGA